MAKRKRTAGSIILGLVKCILALTFCFAAFMITKELMQAHKEQSAFDDLASLVEKADSPTGSEARLTAEPSQTSQPTEPQESLQPVESREPGETAEAAPTAAQEHVPLTQYVSLYERNRDFFGWLRIDDTPVNYPVMHTPDDPQYYLHRAFDKSNAQSGTPFMDGACYEGCGNYILYGHHMKNGSMFGTLPGYAKEEYWEKHPTIWFDTLYEQGEYEVVAAFYGKVIAKGDRGFRYYQYTDLTDPEIFEEYMAQVKAAAIYDTGITAEYGDELITLSTCSYHTDDGRFVVVARRSEADRT